MSNVEVTQFTFLIEIYRGVFLLDWVLRRFFWKLDPRDAWRWRSGRGIVVALLGYYLLYSLK